MLVVCSFGKNNTTLEQIKKYNSKALKYAVLNNDSLEYYAKKAKNSIKKLKLQKLIADSYYDIGDIYLRATNNDSAQKYFDLSMQIRLKIEDYTGVGSIKNKYGYMAWLKNDSQQAKEMYEEAIKIHIIHGDKKELGKAQNNLGDLYRRWGDYTKSIELFLEALSNYKEAKFDEGEAWLNFSIAILYKYVGEYNKSLGYSKKALKLYTKMANENFDSTGVLMCYNQLGFIYTHEFDSLEKGLEYQLKALKLTKNLTIKSVIADAKSGIGQTYFRMEKFDLAKQYIEEAYQLRLDSGNMSGTASNLKFLGYIAAEYNNIPKAISYYDSAMVKAKLIKNRLVVGDLYLAYSKIYEEQSQPKRSLEYYKKYVSLKDSILSGEIASKVASSELEYEIERKTRENEILASQNEIQKLTIEHSKFVKNFLIIMIITSIIILAIVIFLYNKQKQIKTLKGLIPICANCKKIRNDKGMYEQIEYYISEHSDANFSHGICPECMQKLHPEVYKLMDKSNYFHK